MKDKTLAKHYDKLTRRERAVLAINAYGRGDKTEADKLIDAAPGVTHIAPDCGRVVFNVVNAIEWHCLKQAENAASLFLLSIWADSQEWNEDGTSPFADVAIAAHNIITRADGWKLFCGELGLDPIGVLKIASADVTLVDIAERIARGFAPDLPTMREHAHQRLVEAGIAHDEPMPLRTAEQIAAEYRELAQVRG